MTRRRITAIAVAAVVVLPAQASAQNGVTFDPSSPTGKEYQIPLEAARQEASGQTTGVQQRGERSAPLFGEGVGSDSGKSGGHSGPKSSGSNGQKSTSSGSTVENAIAGSHAVRATVPSGGTKSTLTIAGLAIAILLLGGVIGSIARRRQS